MTTVWTQARRAARMNPSIIREILKVTEKPGILSMAGGLPSADTFPVDALKAACDRVLSQSPREALQYAASEGFGPLPEGLDAARGARFLYLLPNYQNPTGRVMSAQRRAEVVEASRRAGVPIVEDNPYGDLWFDEPPPAALSSLWPEGSLYLGSFSKVLTPGFRLGYLIAPPELYPKLLQAKQAADLHTPGFNQRVVYEVVRNGFLDGHIPSIRALYKANRDAMAAALREFLPPGCTWQSPAGGMFFWIQLPPGLDAMALLPRAVDAGVAYVPGAAFYAHQPDARTLRLSFVTLTPGLIAEGVEKLGRMLHEALGMAAEPAP